MVSNVLENGFRQLVDLGFFEVIVPFMLIFAIAFGILEQIKIFGPSSKKYNVLISLSMALIVVGQHVLYPYSKFDVVTMINNALPQIALVLVALVSLQLILGMFGVKYVLGKTRTSGIITYVAFGLVLWIFLASTGLIDSWNLGWISSDIWSLAAALLVFFLVIRYITGSDEGKEKLDWSENLH
jgi:hypothetical protein